MLNINYPFKMTYKIILDSIYRFDSADSSISITLSKFTNTKRLRNMYFTLNYGKIKFTTYQRNDPKVRDRKLTFKKYITLLNL